MNRFGWLLLFVSLGLNLGLGWRLLNPSPEAPSAGPGDRWSEHREGEGQRGGRGRGGGRYGQRCEFLRPAPGDTSAWRQMMERRLERITSRLDLTPEQVASFRVTHRDAATRFRKQRMEIENAEKKLFDLAARVPVPADSVRVAVRDLGRRRALLDSLVTEAMLRELDSLDPEQRRLYLQILPWSRGGGGPDERSGHHGSGDPGRSPGFCGE